MTGHYSLDVHPEDLRATVAAARFEHPSASVAVTVSVGVATLTGAERSASELWRRADEKLYAAKHGGRNRVCS